MIDGVDTSAIDPTVDGGADRARRVQPCRVRTWCILEHDHASPCIEVPRSAIPPTDFGPRRQR